MSQNNKTLADLIPEWVKPSQGDLLVSGICQDSRFVEAGDLFIARSGLQHRGVDFVAQAVSAGAAVVLLEEHEFDSCPDVDVPVIAIPELPQNIGRIAARFYDNPSERMTLIGITGTNGKTSCAHFLAQAMNSLGVKTAIVGTIGNGFPGKLHQSTHTTPDAIGLQRLFAELNAQGANAVVMEVSSHALEQGRVNSVEFDYALFTNLSRDHLDYHGSMQAYGDAKAKLFREFDLKAAVINAEDSYGRQLLSDGDVSVPKVAVGRSQGNICLAAYRMGLKGIEAEVKAAKGNFDFNCHVIGDFNLDNLLLVTAVLLEQGFAVAKVQRALSELEAVPGRMQVVVAADKPLVIIDYAHTPDALEKALQAVRAHTQGMIWCVFGCGGDRDQGKRELMGRVADHLADELVVTNDNPRTEQPESIIAMIKDGIVEHVPTIQADRAAAISLAIQSATETDVVLIAGKGHEDYQEIGHTRYPFSDLLVTRQLMGVAA